MGLLDDAIREHLDLRRRHGADPAEVERAEREALGPVRRAPESDALEPELTDDPGAPLYGDEPGESLYADEHGEPLYADDGHSELLYDDEQSESPHGDGLQPAPFAEEEGSTFESPAAPEPRFDDPEPVGEPAQPIGHEPQPAFDQEAGDWSYSDEPPRETPMPHPAEGHLGGETAEYDVEAALDEEPAAPGEDDVLEETPEFLQDTPDHDRLWFEQRPPKDFDFDG